MEDQEEPDQLAAAINAGLRLPGMAAGSLRAEKRGAWVMVTRAECIQPGALSAREREVLQCLADGLSMAECARQLALSEHTVRTYARGARLRWGAGSLRELITRAAQAGMLKPPEERRRPVQRRATEKRQPPGGTGKSV